MEFIYEEKHWLWTNTPKSLPEVCSRQLFLYVHSAPSLLSSFHIKKMNSLSHTGLGTHWFCLLCFVSKNPDLFSMFCLIRKAAQGTCNYCSSGPVLTTALCLAHIFDAWESYMEVLIFNPSADYQPLKLLITMEVIN